MSWLKWNIPGFVFGGYMMLTFRDFNSKSFIKFAQYIKETTQNKYYREKKMNS